MHVTPRGYASVHIALCLYVIQLPISSSLFLEQCVSPKSRWASEKLNKPDLTITIKYIRILERSRTVVPMSSTPDKHSITLQEAIIFVRIISTRPTIKKQQTLTMPSSLTELYEDEIKAWARDRNPQIAAVGRMGQMVLWEIWHKRSSRYILVEMIHARVKDAIKIIKWGWILNASEWKEELEKAIARYD